MRETIRQSRQRRTNDDTVWSDPFARDLYFGGDLYAEVARERAVHRRRLIKPWAVAGPPA